MRKYWQKLVCSTWKSMRRKGRSIAWRKSWISQETASRKVCWPWAPFYRWAVDWQHTCSHELDYLRHLRQSRNDVDGALSKYSQIADAEPEIAELWNNIGLCFFKKQKFIVVSTESHSNRQRDRERERQSYLICSLGDFIFTQIDLALAAQLQCALQSKPHIHCLWVLPVNDSWLLKYPVTEW